MASKDTKKPANKPVSVAQDAEDVANDQEKATLPADERGDAQVDVGDTGASEEANERYEKAGGLAMSDESDIPVQDPKADAATANMDGEDAADAPEDPNDDAIVQAQEAFDPQIKPDFFSLDEKALDRWITGFTKYMRQQGFTVNGPTEADVTKTGEDVATGMPASISGEVSTKRESTDKDNEIHVYESKYQWRREDGDPITVAETSLLSALEAKRNMAQTAYMRRLEI